MDMMTKLGGRKFLMALLTIGVAVFLETHEKGLSATMAGFLVAVIGAFNISNIAGSNSFLKSKPQGQNDGSVHKKLDDLMVAATQGPDPAVVGQISSAIAQLNGGIQQNLQLTGEIARTLTNLSKRT